MEVVWEDLGALTTSRAREFWMLEAGYLRLRGVVVERVTVIKFAVNDGSGNFRGCFEIEVRSGYGEVDEHDNSRICMERDGNWSEKARCSSKIKPRLRAPSFPQIDIIGAMVIVWRARGKIIRSVLCNIVYAVNCTHMNRPNSSLDWVLSH